MQEGYLILRRIIKKRGIGILRERKILSGLIEDLMPTNIKEKVSLQVAVSTGVAEMFAGIDKEDRVAAASKINTIRQYISEDLGMTKERTAYIVNAFMYGIGMKAVSIDPNENNNYKETAEKYEKEGFKEAAKLLYELVSNAGNEEVKYNCGLSLLRSEEGEVREKGFQILKTLGDRKEACYTLGIEYMEGRIPKRDLKLAYKYLEKALPYPKAILEIGKLYFYGWGVRADIHKAIKYFEQYLKNSSKGRGRQGEDDIKGILNAGPFLVQCYYEDLMRTGSRRSLEKLTEFADIKGFRMAERYLYSYYSNEEKVKAKEFMVARYKKRIEREKENPYLKLSTMRGGFNVLMMDLRVTGAIYLHSKEQYEECALSLKDHLILGEEINKGGKEDNAALSYLLMGELLFYGGAVEGNLLRAEIYLKNYLDRVSEFTDKKSYSRALVLYSKLLLEYKLKLPKWNEAGECVKLAEKLTGESLKEEIMGDMLKKVKYYGIKKDLKRAVSYLERAVEYGYRDDYSIIGMVYLNGDEGIEKNEEKGFYWLKRFYDEYMMERLDLSEGVDIGRIEQKLGECYKNGVGTKQSDCDAYLYYERAAEHGWNA
ncbi:MAG: hypothetical protein K5931_00675 [Lachnospiraceae bacterium]|nr:hypothetical protein [Lachnospiraceae bacterium]